MTDQEFLKAVEGAKEAAGKRTPEEREKELDRLEKEGHGPVAIKSSVDK